MQEATTYLLLSLVSFDETNIVFYSDSNNKKQTIEYVSPQVFNKYYWYLQQTVTIPIILGISYRLFGSLKKKQYLCRDIKNKLLN